MNKLPYIWLFAQSKNIMPTSKTGPVMVKNNPTIKTAVSTDKIKPEHTVKTYQLLDSKKEEMSEQTQKVVLEAAKNCSLESESKLTPSVQQDGVCAAATIEQLMATDPDVINRIGDHPIAIRLIPSGLNSNCLYFFKKKI